jgi:hypothetical protein
MSFTPEPLDVVLIPLLKRITSLNRDESTRFYSELSRMRRHLRLIVDRTVVLLSSAAAYPKIAAETIRISHRLPLSRHCSTPHLCGRNPFVCGLAPGIQDTAHGRRTCADGTDIGCCHLTLEFKGCLFLRGLGKRRIAAPPDQASPPRVAFRGRRDPLIEDAMTAFASAPEGSLLHQFVATFRDEDAAYMGGVRRGFFYLVMEQLFSPDYEMFTTVGGDKYWFQVGESEVAAYQVLGTIGAIAVSNHTVLPIRFPILLYKKLLKIKPWREDLCEINPEPVEFIEQLEGMRDHGENVGDLTSAVTGESLGVHREISLMPGGGGIDVTADNVDYFILRYIDWVCNDSVELYFKRFQAICSLVERK